MNFSQTEQNFTVKFNSGSGGGSGSGQDGFSPIVDVTTIDGGHRVTITDKQGTESFNVMDGETPEKGVDYWTEEDKAEIAEQTQNQIEEATEGISEQVNQNKTDILSANEEIASLKAQAVQQTPLFAESVKWLEENGDTSKVYVLPDGYIYGYKNGVWGNTVVPFVVEERLEKIIEACCDTEIISGGNYNLLRASECVFSSRLQDDSTEIISSNVNNMVTGIIPVEYGKYYTVSCERDGARVSGTLTNASLATRINVYKKDGGVISNQINSLRAGKYSESTYYINDVDIIGIRLHVNIGNIDISSAEKITANKIMITSAETLEKSVEKALNSEYMDGESGTPSETVYTLKHDDTKADKSELNSIKNSLKNYRPIDYDDNYIPNNRLIRGISNLRDETKSKEFEITIRNNSGKVIKNAAIAVGLHNTVGIVPENNNLPFQIYDDVFSESIGFKFFDNGKELPYYIESESDCNYITDKNVRTDQKAMVVFSDGKIAVYNNSVKRMQISDDEGVTWTNICDNITDTPYRILLPDSQDNLFVASADGRTLYKYTSSDGYMSGTEVIDMAVIQENIGTDVEILIGSILAEDSDGNLYLGTYQTEWCCVVMKSSDHGNSWSVVFNTTECQHVHNIFVNKKVIPNEIFIAFDASQPQQKTYVSTDAGVSWTVVDVPYGNRDYAFRYAGENFYIGCGERNVLGGATLYKTTDYNNASAYYPLFDNGQGIRDITNVIQGSDDVLIAGGCVGAPTMNEQLFLSEDRGETWKTVLMRPYHLMKNLAGAGLRTFSKKGNEIISETSSGHAMRFIYGNGAKTILAIVAVGDIPTTGKTISLKTGYVANVEQMGEVLTAYEKTDGKVADICICDGYVIDKVSNKRVMTTDTELCDSRVKIGQTSEYKILANSAHRLNESVNLGKLSRLNFTKGFTVSLLFRKDKTYTEYLSDDKYHVIFSTGDTKLVLWYRSLVLLSGTTNIFAKKLYIADDYLLSVNDDYVRVTAYFTGDTLPIARIYTDNKWTVDDIVCTEYPITQNFSENDFIVGNSLGSGYAEMPNIARIEIYNRVLSHGEIMSLTNGCNLVTDNSQYN